MNLLLLEADEFATDGTATVTGDRARHLLDVLGATVGSPLRIGVIDGTAGIGVVTAAGEGSVSVRWVEKDGVPPRPRVDLLLALPRPKVLQRLWAQIAALGVGQVMLTNASKVERYYFDSHVLRPGGYRPLLVEGLQQARDTRLPVVSMHRQFRKLIEDDLDGLFDGGVRLLAHPGTGTTRIGAALRRLAPQDRVLLAVGPEGGWNEFERALLVRHRFVEVALGPRTLATTTAVVALLTLVHDAIGHAPGPSR
jgi:16S rRNA (uracil1498-N3)-methyltransferase